ncbi:MAG: hypothetical protein L0287_11690 [Anaerolineae bacterium]|nr:hypothetical protein [Anaerolineae bacterium]
MYGLFITVLPVFSFWAAELLKPEWQSGDLSDYIILLLFPEASPLFFPLLAYSIICYLLLLIAPTRYSSLSLIRYGIYTGTILALQYSIILLLYLLDTRYSFSFFLLWLFPLYFPKIYQWVVRKWDARRARSGLAILVLIVIVIAIIVNREEFFPLFLAIVALVIAAPFWSFLMAGQAAIWLSKNYETRFTLPRGLGITAWLVAYAAAWRYDILKMYVEYAKLPTAPPDCYIATAAARGHPTFVRSWSVQRADGKSMQVNAQMQILKCAELASIVVVPRLHQYIRELYDATGKPLARMIRNPFLADVAYLLLKPFEWFARAGLKFVFFDIDSISKRLYKN